MLVEHPEEFVNVLAGTAGGQMGGTHHSSGNALPLLARPWGFNHWSPQTTNDRTSWWFDAAADTFRGIRCTHQPSPWVGDYGWFLLRPFMGSPLDGWLGFTSYHATNAVRPWLLDIIVGPQGIRVELAPTEHGAVLRVTFPPSMAPSTRRICAWVPRGKIEKDADEKRAAAHRKPTGSCQATNGGIDLESRKFTSGVPAGGDFTLYARLEAKGLEAEESDTLPVDCFVDDFAYVPMNMPGQQRTQESDVFHCQSRCAAVEGCAHFTFWPDGGCHLQDAAARSEKSASLVAGPALCPSRAREVRQCCFLLGEQLEAEVRVATSFISAAQALRALDKELEIRSLDEVAEEGRAIWHSELLAVEVKDAGPPSAMTLRRLEVFYTCLYRTLLFPRQLDEWTPDGRRHWSPYDGRVHDGPGVTDNGFWDTFRTVYPLLTLAYPRKLGDLLEGWLNAYREGGWLPKWASPGYRDSMVGTFADVVFADAILKNISGFDVAVAWEALKKDAFEHSGPKDTSRGKFGLHYYAETGYIPVDVKISEACSRTLDFAFADAATAAAAERLGHHGAAQALRGRSLRGLRALYDARTGLMGHRLASGAFKDEPAETWGDCFTEGSAWHHSFPPFDLAALAELHGGEEQLLAKLRALFAEPGDFRVGSYKVEIHEMREMRMLGLGQYAHNNQPVHHLPFLFALLGDRNTTARLVRRVLSTAYSPEGFAGDEDNGEMGAWFVLGALGLYAAAPGVSEDYVLSAIPLFPRMYLRELDVTIEAPAAPQDSPMVAQVLWRAQPLGGVTVPYSALRSGGVLHFAAPGDAKLGRIVSNLRGALEGAVHRARGAVRHARGISTTGPPETRHEAMPESRRERAAAAAAAIGLPAAADAVSTFGGAIAAAVLLPLLLLCSLLTRRLCHRRLAGTAEKPD